MGGAVCKLNAWAGARVPSAAPSSPRGSSLVSCPACPVRCTRTVRKHRSDLAGLATLFSQPRGREASFSVSVVTKYTAVGLKPAQVLSEGSKRAPQGTLRCPQGWSPREAPGDRSSCLFPVQGHLHSLVGGPVLRPQSVSNLWAPVPAPSLTLTLGMTLGPPRLQCHLPSQHPPLSPISKVPFEHPFTGSGTQTGHLWGLCLHRGSRGRGPR